jgi:imidazole glycerol-phosphate synthase subunit HisH
MVAIIDYNAGNTKSVINALKSIGTESILTSDRATILLADKVILPGVGHASNAMHELQERNLIQTIKEVKSPFLGICVGMQLLMEQSEEGNTPCIGIFKGEVKKFKSDNVKVPKVGWNTVSINHDALFQNIPNDSFFYFVHSYYVPQNTYTIATSDYTERYTVAIKKDNYYGVQFHPEKSGLVGRQLLINFLSIKL